MWSKVWYSAVKQLQSDGDVEAVESKVFLFFRRSEDGWSKIQEQIRQGIQKLHQNSPGAPRCLQIGSLRSLRALICFVLHALP